MNFNNIRKQISEFRDKLSAYIDTLPDGNDGVEFLDKKKKVAIVKFSTMQKSGIMSAGHYINHRAKDEMRRIILKTKLESLDSVIERIIQTGNIPTTSNYTIKANPQFIAKIKEMWEEQQK